MRIVNKKELATMPNGTVFMLYRPDMVYDEIHIITGHYDDNSGWNGELTLDPFIEKDKDDRDYFYTQWCTVDTATCDYNDNQLFAVFSKTEVVQMINCLQWALTGCESYFDEDVWHHGYEAKPIADDEME